LIGQPSQNGPLTVQPALSLPPDTKKAPFVVPTSIVTPSRLIVFVLRFFDYAPFIQPALNAASSAIMSIADILLMIADMGKIREALAKADVHPA
jgi:hypothetical protein